MRISAVVDSMRQEGGHVQARPTHAAERLNIADKYPEDGRYGIM